MNPNNSNTHGENGNCAGGSVNNTNTPVAETDSENHIDTNMPVAANCNGNGYAYTRFTNMYYHEHGNIGDTNVPIGANHYGNGYAHNTNMYVGENSYGDGYHAHNTTMYIGENYDDTSMPVNENHYGSGNTNNTNVSGGENHYENCYGNDYSNAYEPMPQQVDYQFFTTNTGMINQNFCTNVSNNFMVPQPRHPYQLLNPNQPQVIPPSGYYNGVPPVPPSMAMSDDEYFKSLPIGYRFCPYDYELIEFYLKRKLANQHLPRNCIHEVNLYDFHPQDLARTYKLNREDSWYFFTSRNRKYPKGDRPDRAADNGYWKPTATDKPIVDANNPIKVVGHKKSLDYYEGKHPAGKKTNWKMHEYLTAEQLTKSASNNSDKYRRDRDSHSMMLNDWVLCRIYKKKDKKNINDDDDEDADAEDSTAADDGYLKCLQHKRNIGNASASASASACASADNSHGNHLDHVPPPEHRYQFGGSNYYGLLPTNHDVTGDSLLSHGGSSSAELVTPLITVSISSATQHMLGQPPVVHSSQLIINGPQDHIHDTSTMTESVSAMQPAPVVEDDNHTSSALVVAEENNGSKLPNNAAVAALSPSENNLDQENDPTNDLEEWLNIDLM